MWIRSFLALCALALLSTRTFASEELLEANFAIDIQLWAELDEETESFREAIQLLKIPTFLQRSDWRAFPASRASGICTICKSLLQAVINLRRKGVSDETLRLKGIKICSLLNLASPEVCDGAITLNLPAILYIVDNKQNLTSNTVCGVLLESRSCPITDPEFDWTVNVDEGPSTPIQEQQDDTTLKVLQLTDLHYDPNYEPFGNVLCKQPTCCRKGQNSTNNNGKVAGYWGDYNYCDTPWHAVLDVMDHLKDTHPVFDYVYFTGDIIDHGVWETTRDGNKESVSQSYNKIHETFPDTPVFPILGNHEPHPLDLFAPKSVTREDLSTQWLYDFIADLWIGLELLPESTRATIQQGGFYTVSPKKGFRIIALNSNVCYCYNWWLWYSPRDPDDQLQWLADTLLQAESDNEFVHILSHVPANDNHCLSTWRREYMKIVARFSHIIKAQFNGHTHNDEISLFYNEKSAPNNIAWNGGSLTAYSNLNPNYKVFYVNASDYAVTDYDNWMYDLKLANLNVARRPRWYKSYSFKDEYGLTKLTPKSLSNWLSIAVKSDTLRNKYYRNFFKQAEPSLATPCNANCRKEYICRVITSMDADKICSKMKA